jgi:NTP pyrophosphatase (non-canonical NTP hydrolase)
MVDDYMPCPRCGKTKLVDAWCDSPECRPFVEKAQARIKAAMGKPVELVRHHATDSTPFGFNTKVWPGLAKLMEELGELQQLLGKVVACSDPNATYWDGRSLRPELIEELGDVRAAMIFFCENNGLSKIDVHTRADRKLALFNTWKALENG